MNGEDIGNMIYCNKIQTALTALNNERESIQEAAKIVAKCIDKDGIIYFFGCGHSHIFGEEFFYRAGGLANVQPILYEPLMLHQGAAQSSVNEKKNNYVDSFIEQYSFTPNDVLIVVSTSGINPVPIDVAVVASALGTKVITISSFVYAEIEQSRHQNNYYLKQIGDVNIDNHVPHGDAILSTKGINHSPISTVIGITLIQEIVAQALNQVKIEQLPIFISGNISGSKEHNQQLVNKYRNRVPMLALNLEE